MKNPLYYLLIALMMIATSCSGDETPNQENPNKNSENDTLTKEPDVKEEIDTLAGIPGYCKPFFLVGNELTFIQERTETINCAIDEETGEAVDIEPVPKITRKIIKVTVSKVEKNKKGVWIATLKHNGDFPKKWFTDETSIWNNEMAGRFPVEPRTKDQEIDGVSISVYFNKTIGSWAYDEQIGDGLSGIHFDEEKGINGFVYGYSSMCESIELDTKLKTSKL